MRQKPFIDFLRHPSQHGRRDSDWFGEVFVALPVSPDAGLTQAGSLRQFPGSNEHNALHRWVERAEIISNSGVSIGLIWNDFNKGAFALLEAF